MKRFIMFVLCISILINIDFSENSFIDVNKKAFDYFLKETKNAELTYYIIKWCNLYRVPVCLAFALCKQESGFRQYAKNVNYKDGKIDSIDRSYFQLNNLTFSNLQIEDFYNVKINTLFGIMHLAYCLEEAGGNYRNALHIYNGGSYNFSRNRIRRLTKVHAERIIKVYECYQTDLDSE